MIPILHYIQIILPMLNLLLYINNVELNIPYLTPLPVEDGPYNR